MENKNVKTQPTPTALLKKAKAFQKPEPSLIELYKDTIIFLKNEKKLTILEIEKFLNDNNIDVKKYQITKYLKSLSENK